MARAEAVDESRVQAPMRARAPLDVASPHPGERWRVVASAIDYTTDDGVTWERVDLRVDAPVTAGVSPSRGVCWLVGRAGTILLTTDGRNWRRVAFPEQVDLVAVDARDARTASVTTGDGRVFTTSDGGAGWQPR